jgi:hypothetical protein
MNNPHWCYATSFLGATLVYQLGWSRIFPSLSAPILFFVSTTILFHLILGWMWKKKWKPVPMASQQVSPTAVTLFLYFLWTIEFIYGGGIPLIKIMLQQPYNYRLFGVPSLHVFIVTFASFYTVFLFHLYVLHRQRINLILYIINLFASLLIFNRGMFTFILVATIFVYLSLVRFRWLVFVLVSIVSFFCFLYIFGMLGTLRESAESKTKYDSNIFLGIGQAEDSFRNSFIPKEFFWGYMYISSPLANLQTNINSQPVQGLKNLTLRLFIDEVVFDFASKRLNKLMGWERLKDQTIPGPFNVSTVYSRSYCYGGWWGMAFMAILVGFVPWLYLRLLPMNPYALTGASILCTMYLFLGFDNMIRFSGLSFQLVYPFAFPLFIRIKSWVERTLAK